MGFRHPPKVLFWGLKTQAVYDRLSSREPQAVFRELKKRADSFSPSGLVDEVCQDANNNPNVPALAIAWVRLFTLSLP